MWHRHQSPNPTELGHCRACMECLSLLLGCQRAHGRCWALRSSSCMSCRHWHRLCVPQRALLRKLARWKIFRGLFWTLAASVLFWDPILTYTLLGPSIGKHQYTFLIVPAGDLINDGIYLLLNLLATNIVPPTQTTKQSVSSLYLEQNQEGVLL